MKHVGLQFLSCISRPLNAECDIVMANLCISHAWYCIEMNADIVKLFPISEGHYSSFLRATDVTKFQGEFPQLGH